MQKIIPIITLVLVAFILLLSCRERQLPQLAKEISAINLKTGRNMVTQRMSARWGWT